MPLSMMEYVLMWIILAIMAGAAIGALIDGPGF
jgi:hypothetical protein